MKKRIEDFKIGTKVIINESCVWKHLWGHTGTVVENSEGSIRVKVDKDPEYRKRGFHCTSLDIVSRYQWEDL